VARNEYHVGDANDQVRRRRPRRRKCILKGCERWFQPQRPQECYCSDTCRQEGKRWRRWRASQSWRSSERGKERRRAQSRRYRERLRERQRQRREAAQLADASAEEACEGQRAAVYLGTNSCGRPGCYELFIITSRSPLQKYCSCGCRQAMRRVRQREARWFGSWRSEPAPRGRAPPRRPF
jgi:hypothetical protein